MPTSRLRRGTGKTMVDLVTRILVTVLAVSFQRLLEPSMSTKQPAANKALCELKNGSCRSPIMRIVEPLQIFRSDLEEVLDHWSLQ